jgi:hypothetical protein
VINNAVLKGEDFRIISFSATFDVMGCYFIKALQTLHV